MKKLAGTPIMYGVGANNNFLNKNNNGFYEARL